ncbi:MAG TPA: hypothetical protein DCY48_00900 [Candidatus Magasanikbacteria bacterium]|nr:MAG: hypothetical protein A3I74_02440 [Candidatus Magasanikbacteria bacterium RIFCSPLOWO2_02_FULL_47_16]OGH79633.1 MAG: hypothetical protein A3C10_00960 [Candidatus Magasanikbacteria bacterium RIFCSPHIGHO2_02_FULL_48_18]OGH82347.1 MAG: hypothetical protein A3G08_03210 [Candidatus Magasanikbacteria bacterium RIFCSPLOWO2_12_FULL_47_9b]HAZ28319.1 hypothetical protein [Candidatus Magasanikbacteria bacterium]
MQRISITVAPRSSTNTFVGLLPDGSVKIKLRAVPADGEANKALVSFLSKTWHVRKTDMRIISGFSSRKKILEIQDDTFSLDAALKLFQNKH